MIRTDLPVGISVSGGGASIAMVLLMLRGVLPRPEHVAVFFADTREEHLWTYDEIDAVRELCGREGVPFISCSADEGLGDHLVNGALEQRPRADQPPLYVAKDGGGVGVAMHKCTREFKIRPMRRAQSEWLRSIGKPKQIIKWVGFTADETYRMIRSMEKREVEWETLDFPLARIGYRRAQVDEFLAKHYHSVRFSMCIHCPAKTFPRWEATPVEQRTRVFSIDESIRDMSRAGLTEGDCYLTDELVPIERLLRVGPRKALLPGMAQFLGCDGGHCFL